MNLINKELIISLLIVVITIIVITILTRIFKKNLKEIKDRKNKINKKRITIIKLINNLVKYLIVIVAILFILQLNGVNVSSIIAGLSVCSVIIGLALQDALKDIIMGINIIVDDYFNVGDVISIDKTEGKVLEVGLKVTKLEDINTKDVLVIANRNISKALNISNQFDIDIPISYNKKIVEIEKILDEIIEEVNKLKEVTKVQYKGVQDFKESAMLYKIRIWSLPEKRPQTKRDIRRIIKLKLDEHNIEIPYNQIVVHNK